MNVFITSLDPVVCAKDHCTIHQNKMIVEYAQLLSTAHHELGSELDAKRIYKSTHVNHPSAKWVREAAANYIYTWQLAMELCKLYRKRTAKVHATEKVILLLTAMPVNIPIKSMTEPAQAMPDMFKKDNVCEAYQHYLSSKFMEWQLRDKPLIVKFMKGHIPNWLVEFT